MSKLTSSQILAISRLGKFVKIFCEAGIADIPEFNVWKKKNADLFNQTFEYPDNKVMPQIISLVKPFFHPSLPLVGLNYTQLAHNTLHAFPEGWTTALRLCRGIVFDRDGNLIALPFPKFFNYGENPESSCDLTGHDLEITEKLDGHLGIIFRYKNRFVVTTRGSFDSPTVRFARRMLGKYVRENDWHNRFKEHITLLVEIIHPKTMVHVDYHGQREFKIIGGYTTNEYMDMDYDGIKLWGTALNLPVTNISEISSMDQLISHIRDRSVANKEGYVVRIAGSNLRIKFKFETYIGMMVNSKLSYAYIMQRMMSGNLQKMLITLPEEIYQQALAMVGEIIVRISDDGTDQEKWTRLYDLPHTTSDNHFRSICRKFVKSAYFEIVS